MLFRAMLTFGILSASLVVPPAAPPAHAAPAPPSASPCPVWKITGYVPNTPTVPSHYTYDGSYVFSGEPMAAATSLPINTYVSVPHLANWGMATDYRIADRGRLAGNQIDILVWTGDVRSSVKLAYAITGYYPACVYGG